jgi:hypothetical protein
MAFVCTAAELISAAEAGTAVATVAEGASLGSAIAEGLSSYSLADLATMSPESLMSEGFGQGATQAVENTALNPNQMLDPLTGQPSQIVNPQRFNVQQQRMQDLLDSGGDKTPMNTGDTGIKMPTYTPVGTPTPSNIAPSGFGGDVSQFSSFAPNNTPLSAEMQSQLPSLQGSNYPSASTPATDMGGGSGIRMGSGANGLTIPQNTPLSPTPGIMDSLSKGFDSVTEWMKKHPYLAATGIYGAANLLGLNKTVNPSLPASQQIGMAPIQPMANYTSSNVPQPNTNIYRPRYAAGGILQAGGTVEHMSQLNTMGNNQDYPGAKNYSSAFSNPNTMPIAQNVVTGSQDVNTDPYTGQEKMAGGGIVAFKTGGSSATSMGDTGIYTDADPNTRNLDPFSASLARYNKLGSNYGMTLGSPITAISPLGRMSYQPIDIQQQAAAQQAQQAAAQNMTEAASGGIMQATRYSLGGYAQGGNPRLLDGPGDGMSDNIPAVIGDKQPARLADGEFVVPADVVSGLGNGSTKAGAKKLHGMMDKVRVARTGTKKQGKEINSNKFMPS